ncbi:hypothetical protein EKH79_01205 [Dyella dinghuensis]|uniref:Peptidase S53 domain-containing protein n=1 Tax=Dyella dinghuensis TaxID=1920169 RepID=A0A3S0PH27_9GAMM|nr:protease pro-enzyme activation domain-containing protein [Dyella dinghuensis]RUL66477.1 hypothetical protein EKH79_01205 [Dyella dinghuensis]
MFIESRHRPWCIALAVTLGSVVSPVWSAATPQATNAYPDYQPDSPRINAAIDNSNLVTVQGSRPALAVAKYDKGPLPSSQLIRNVTLLLKRSDEKQKQADAYSAQLTNPSSPYFHHWLTPAQIGQMFGPAQSDVNKVTQWIKSQGLTVTSVSPTGMTIHFSGTAGALGNAFHTSLHSYSVNGEQHFANAGAEQIPAALQAVVQNAVPLHNFFPKPLYHNVGLVKKDKNSGRWQTATKDASAPNFTVPPGTNSGTAYDVAPADFNTIYNVNPLWQQGTPIRGAGQTVVVLEQSDVLPGDIQTFRQAFLPANATGTVSYIHPLLYPADTSCPDPGEVYPDEGEAALDAEWAGAAAPDANIVVASCSDAGGATFAPFQAAENITLGTDSRFAVMPAILSLSYGECEPEGLVDGNASYAGFLWQTASMEGVTVFVSSGDAGAVACDQGSEVSFQGTTVNGLGSTPYNVSVGGTDFHDLNETSKYWTSTNLPLDSSAISYVPEMTWNDSCASSVIYPLLGFGSAVESCNSLTPAQQQAFLNTVGGGGGASTNWYQQPWQTGVYGISNYNFRTMPDVSLFAANGLFGHALVYCMSDPNVGGTTCDYSQPDDVYFNSAGGTSFAAPAMAGVQALINQAVGRTGGNYLLPGTGNILPALYSIATKEYGTNGSPNTAMLAACNASNGAAINTQCVFNDITVGDNAEVCLAGSRDCYSGAGVEQFGISSNGGATTLAPAWMTNAGYDNATGLGSVNVTNLVHAVAKFYQPFQRGYVAPYDFMSGSNGVGDGFSDIALVDPVKGTLTSLGMKGSVVVQKVSQSIAPGYSIGAIGNILGDNGVGQLAWTGPDNRLYLWDGNGTGNYFPMPIGNVYAAGWKLIGSGTPDGSKQSQLFWFNATMHQFGWWKVAYNWSTFTYEATISPITTVAADYVPTLADVNGDGYADIVWTSTTDNSVYVWINDQQGGFVDHRIADHPAGFVLFGAGDVNGDGNTDLIWTNPSSNQMSWWLMDGFTVLSQQTVSVAPGYTMSSIADYDGDGLADILWVGKAGDVYEWQSNGSSFQSFRVADAAGNPLVIPAGTQVQTSRLQGSATGGENTSVGSSH